MSGTLYIGTSGWSYDAWRESFYAGVSRGEWLRYYATRFPAVEVNATFYHQLARTTFAQWRTQTPRDFKFSIKGHRYLTHVKRLRFSSETLGRGV